MYKGKFSEEKKGKGKVVSVYLEQEEDYPKFISDFFDAIGIKKSILDLRKREGAFTYEDFYSSSDDWWNGCFVDVSLKFSGLQAKILPHELERALRRLLGLGKLDFLLHTDMLLLRFHGDVDMGFVMIGIKKEKEKIEKALSALLKN